MLSQFTLCNQELPEQISWPVKVALTSPKVKPWSAARLAVAVFRWSEAPLMAARSAR